MATSASSSSQIVDPASFPLPPSRPPSFTTPPCPATPPITSTAHEENAPPSILHSNHQLVRPKPMHPSMTSSIPKPFAALSSSSSAAAARGHRPPLRAMSTDGRSVEEVIKAARRRSQREGLSPGWPTPAEVIAAHRKEKEAEEEVVIQERPGEKSTEAVKASALQLNRPLNARLEEGPEGKMKGPLPTALKETEASEGADLRILLRENVASHPKGPAIQHPAAAIGPQPCHQSHSKNPTNLTTDTSLPVGPERQAMVTSSLPPKPEEPEPGATGPTEQTAIHGQVLLPPQNYLHADVLETSPLLGDHKGGAAKTAGSWAARLGSVFRRFFKRFCAGLMNCWASLVRSGKETRGGDRADGRGHVGGVEVDGHADGIEGATSGSGLG